MDKETILLSWKPPRHPNGIITKYKVYMRPLDDLGLVSNLLYLLKYSQKSNWQLFFIVNSDFCVSGER